MSSSEPNLPSWEEHTAVSVQSRPRSDTSSSSGLGFSFEDSTSQDHSAPDMMAEYHLPRSHHSAPHRRTRHRAGSCLSSTSEVGEPTGDFSMRTWRSSPLSEIPFSSSHWSSESTSRDIRAGSTSTAGTSIVLGTPLTPPVPEVSSLKQERSTDWNDSGENQAIPVRSLDPESTPRFWIQSLKEEQPDETMQREITGATTSAAIDKGKGRRIVHVRDTPEGDIGEGKRTEQYQSYFPGLQARGTKEGTVKVTGNDGLADDGADGALRTDVHGLCSAVPILHPDIIPPGVHTYPQVPTLGHSSSERALPDLPYASRTETRARATSIPGVYTYPQVPTLGHSSSERALPNLPSASRTKTRSRATSIALSILAPSTSNSSRELARGSSPDSTSNSRVSSLRGNLRKSRSAFMRNFAQKTTTTNSGARTPEPIFSPPEPQAFIAGEKGKGNVRGLVKKLMVRSHTTISVPTTERAEVTALTEPHNPPSLERLARRSQSFDVLQTLSRSRLDQSADLIARLSHEIGEEDEFATAKSVDLSTIIPDRDYFNDVLPHELQIKIFQSIIDLHVAEHSRDVKLGQWVGFKASSTRWVGENAGRKEILNLGRVCKAWHNLAYDGQLWTNANLSPFVQHLTPMAASRILLNSGRFIRNLDLRGWSHLSSQVFLCSLASPKPRLERLNLQGCTSLSSHALASFIAGSPSLLHINLKGLKAVNREVMEAIRFNCHWLQNLNVSHCRNIYPLDPDFFVSTSGNRPTWPHLKSLSAAELAGDDLLQVLSTAAPELIHLDVSHSRDIHDDDIKDFVAVDKAVYMPAFKAQLHRPHPLEQVIFIYPSDAGQSASAFECDGLIPRRLTVLRHLNLSQCRNITDTGCNYLAYAVPDLEILELASIGDNLKDDGLIRLLASCPKLRKLDTEGALELTDRFITALVPPQDEPSVGSQLTTLNLGFVSLATNDNLLKMLRGCPKLSHIRLDNTSTTDVFVKEFVRRRARSSSLSVVDCRNISRNVAEALERNTRPRAGWRGWDSRPLGYQDGSRPKSRRDECNDHTVLQTFWTWSKVPKAPTARHLSDVDYRLGDPVLHLAGGIMHPEEARGCTIM